MSCTKSLEIMGLIGGKFEWILEILFHVGTAAANLETTSVSRLHGKSEISHVMSGIDGLISEIDGLISRL